MLDVSSLLAAVSAATLAATSGMAEPGTPFVPDLHQFPTAEGAAVAVTSTALAYLGSCRFR